MNNAVRLDELKVGERGRVCDYEEREEVCVRLREVGLTRGVAVLVKRFAPLGDPIEIEVRGYQLALRKKDAAGIWVEKIL